MNDEDVKKELDALVESMQTPEARAGAEKFLQMTPEELGQAAVAAVAEEPPRPEFVPSKYARRTCRDCGGSGVVRVHLPRPPDARGRRIVVPSDNNTAISPCGCASKRYLKEVRGY
jgi:hypothetical protein